MKWDNLGLVYKVESRSDWQQSHAYVPTPVIIDDFIRVFVSFWDNQQVGRIGYVDVAIKNPTTILRISDTPSLDIGPTGSWDCKGVTPVSYVFKNGYLNLLYTGWGEHKELPYTLFTGVATSSDKGKSFTKLPFPILGINDEQPSVRTAAYIQYMSLLDEYWIWYVGGKEWYYTGDKLTPTYDLCLIKSKNLYNWKNKSYKVVMHANKNIDEYAIGRPCIIQEAGLFKLFYSSRRYNGGYRLGYAESIDGENWIRKDSDLNLPLSKDGHDSDMQCFSYVLPTEYGTYLFYNGNNYGKQGFGVAVLEK